jgi:phenylacetic acid degradation protein
MPIYEFEGVRPIVHATAFVHPTASLIGDVTIGAECLVGPGASLRGDLGRVVMKDGSNVQDNCTVHTFPGKDCVIEEEGHVGHGAVLHGCRVQRGAMIGMNAVVMDGAVIGESAFVAAMAFVKADTEIAPRTLVGGIPAKVLRALRDEEIAWKDAGTKVYQHLARRYLAAFRAAEPLRAEETGRARVPFIEYRPKGA